MADPFTNFGIGGLAQMAVPLGQQILSGMAQAAPAIAQEFGPGGGERIRSAAAGIAQGVYNLGTQGANLAAVHGVPAAQQAAQQAGWLGSDIYKTTKEILKEEPSSLPAVAEVGGDVYSEATRILGNINPLLSLGSVLQGAPSEAFEIFYGPQSTHQEFRARKADLKRDQELKQAAAEVEKERLRVLAKATSGAEAYNQAKLVRDLEGLVSQNEVEKERVKQEKLATTYAQHAVVNPRLYGPYEPGKSPLTSATREKTQWGVTDTNLYTKLLEPQGGGMPAYHFGLRDTQAYQAQAAPKKEKGYTKVHGAGYRGELREEKRLQMGLQSEMTREKWERDKTTWQEEREEKQRKKEKKRARKEQEAMAAAAGTISQEEARRAVGELERAKKTGKKDKWRSLLGTTAAAYKALPREDVEWFIKRGEKKLTEYSEIKKERNRPGSTPTKKWATVDEKRSRLQRRVREARQALNFMRQEERRKHEEEKAAEAAKRARLAKLQETTTTTQPKKPKKR